MPFLVGPAMKKRMWMRPLTERHLAVLQSMGVTVVPPISKVLACGYVGVGGLASVMFVLQCKLTRARFSQLAVKEHNSSERCYRCRQTVGVLMCCCCSCRVLHCMLYIGALKLRKQYRAERCSDANCSNSSFLLCYVCHSLTLLVVTKSGAFVFLQCTYY
jgi:Flavoprotein